MSVEIDPPEQLEFNRPFTLQVARNLTVTNHNDVPIAYKVKTTAPRSYCVRPNSGRIEPGQSVEVQVLLQAMKADMPLDMKCKDKFLLQSTKITDSSENVNLAELWNQIEKNVIDGHMSKDLIQQKKIRCVWGPPLDPKHSETHTNENETPHNKANGVPNSHVEDTPEVNPPPVSIGVPQPAAAANIPTYSTPITSTVQPPTAQQRDSSSIEAQLAEAKAQIAALTKQLEVTGGSGLRQRNTSGRAGSEQASRPSSSARDVLHTAVEQGVPVKIVAYLCLAAFLLAYLFF